MKNKSGFYSTLYPQQITWRSACGINEVPVGIKNIKYVFPTLKFSPRALNTIYRPFLAKLHLSDLANLLAEQRIIENLSQLKNIRIIEAEANI